MGKDNHEDRLYERHLRQSVESAPAARFPKNKVAPLKDPPKFTPPTLDKLEVLVHEEEVPVATPEEIELRMQEYLQKFATVELKKVGESVELGDELLLDMFAREDGFLVQGSYAHNKLYRLLPDPLYPDLAKTLSGSKVGSRVQIRTKLSDNYPAIQLQGVEVTFHVHILGARRVELPKPPADVLEGLLEVIRAEIEKDRARFVEKLVTTRVLNVLCERTKIENSGVTRRQRSHSALDGNGRSGHGQGGTLLRRTEIRARRMAYES